MAHDHIGGRPLSPPSSHLVAETIRRLQHVTPFVLLGALSVLAVVHVLTHWNQPRMLSGSVPFTELAGAVLLVTGLVVAVWRRSTSPLRTPVTVALLLDTWLDTWVLSTLNPGLLAHIGSWHLAISVVWVGAVALLYFDRPAAPQPAHDTTQPG